MLLLRSLIAILILPFTAAVVVPVVIVMFGNFDLAWGVSGAARYFVLTAGAMIICAGLFLMWHTISMFFNVGEGTLAPWDPPKKLVVEGIYRHVRNPMISGVLCIMLGETIVLGSLYMTVWFALFACANFIYLPLLEEPKLKERFGEDYEVYKKNVPRWIPRRRPWSQP